MKESMLPAIHWPIAITEDLSEKAKIMPIKNKTLLTEREMKPIPLKDIAHSSFKAC